MRLAIPVAAILAVLPSPSQSQGLVTPASHWGAVMLPELGNRDDWGLHFLGFTQFGKEIDSVTHRYFFSPYNDTRETIGFNILTYSRTRNSHGYQPVRPRDSRQEAAPVVDPSPLSQRLTFAVGIQDDNIPRFLQNNVIHQGHLINGSNPILPVPREIGDTPDHISLGKRRLLPLMAEVSDEYFMRLFFARHNDSREERVPTPYFVGGGWALGTLDQELFVHVGSSVAEWQTPRWARVVGLRSVGLGGIVRTGFLHESHYFNDLMSQYINLQGIARAGLSVWSFPLRFEFAATSTTGFFVAARTPAELATNAQTDNPAERDHYQTKTGLSERFYSIRVRIGDFTFETYNDSFGGKDKGPSFGASVNYNVYRPPRIASSTRKPSAAK